MRSSICGVITSLPDYPGAIDYPAHSTNTLGPPCQPKGWVLHTPEEKADGDPGTPRWFAAFHANPDQRGSTHYFVSYLGFVFQCVSEANAPIANGVLGKPYPAWANDKVSLNRQSLSVEIEGYAATIRDTISPAQTTALLGLLAYGCEKYGIPKDRAHIIGHYEVATNRTDPGTLNIDALVAELQEEEVPTQQEWAKFLETQLPLNERARRELDVLVPYKEANEKLTDSLSGKIDTLVLATQDLAAVLKAGGDPAAIKEIEERLDGIAKAAGGGG